MGMEGQNNENLEPSPCIVIDNAEPSCIVFLLRYSSCIVRIIYVEEMLIVVSVIRFCGGNAKSGYSITMILGQ